MTKRTLAEWRTFVANRLLARTVIQRWISSTKWTIYPLLVRYVPRLALAIHEPESMGAFWDAIRPGMIVVDAGANMGGYSVVASRRTGANGRVYAFEPEPRNFAVLTKRLANYANVTPVQKALSATDGTASLHLDTFHAGHSLVTLDDRVVATSITVPVTSLDSFIASVGERGIDVLKLDVEGVELDVLRGMQNLLGGSNAPVILCEVHAPNRPEDVIAVLQPYGYTSKMLDADLTGAAHDVPVHVLATPRR